MWTYRHQLKDFNFRLALTLQKGIENLMRHRFVRIVRKQFTDPELRMNTDFFTKTQPATIFYFFPFPLFKQFTHQYRTRDSELPQTNLGIPCSPTGILRHLCSIGYSCFLANIKTKWRHQFLFIFPFFSFCDLKKRRRE